MKNVLEYLDQTAKKYPDKIAFADETGEITFAVLRQKAFSLGEKIPFQGKRVAVAVDNRIGSIVSFFAILYSGNCYIPIDREMPSKRTQKMLDAAKADFFLGEKGDEFESSVSFLDRDVLACGTDGEKPKKAGGVSAADPCYMVFTSGSTGIPKAVLKSHHSVIRAIEAYCESTGITDQDVIGNQAPLDYDAAAKDLYAAIYAGASCVLIPKMYFAFPKKLLTFMADQKITSVAWSAAAFSLIAEMKGLEKITVPTLRRIMFSGAVLAPKHLMYWQSHYPNAVYYNLYGPTEITGTTAIYRPGIVERSDYDMPLGRPLKHTQIILTDKERKRIDTPNVIGEIVIISDSVADGYFNDETASKNVFCANVYTEDAGVAYFSGDLGHFDENGVLYFNGRKDHMVKHHGHRVELGEIESVANGLDGVGLACCLYDDQKEKIMLIYESAENIDKQLYREMKTLLPKYMLPNRLIAVEKMILTRTGKVDRMKMKEKYIDAKA